ncbi:MAG TPA: RND family transporter, partial [Methanomicrobiales archaeon]|nr:RND family transporter [Methanomicrobiales archaeon]
MTMRSPYEMLADIISRRPRMIAAIVLVVLVFALIGTTFISMETGEGTYIDENTQRYILLNHYSSTYQSDAIMVLIESD